MTRLTSAPRSQKSNACPYQPRLALQFALVTVVYYAGARESQYYIHNGDLTRQVFYNVTFGRETVKLQTPKHHDRVRFGEYAFDPSLGLLERGGHAVVLPEQAKKVLVQLLERNGELVARDQMCKVLWPDVTISEYDQSINNIVSRLRWYLRDDSQNPRYIETIPKLGYRFLAEIERLPAEESPDLSTDGSLSTPSVASSTTVVGSEQATMRYVTPARSWLWICVAAGCLFLIAAVFAAVRWSGSSKKENHDLTTIAISPFQIPDADEATIQLADSLRLDLTNSLSQLPSIQVKANQGFPSIASGNAQQLTGLAQLGVDEILFVHIHRNSSEYLIDMELDKANGLSNIASWRYRGTAQQLNVMMQQARDDIFMASRGQRLHRPPHGGTNVPEAYELYLHARYHAHQRLQEPLETAVQEYRQAIALDPEFANAYSGLADAYVALGDYFFDSHSQAYQSAHDALKHALALDPSLAEAQALDGYLVFRKDWNFAEGEAHLRQAIRLDGAQARYHLWLSIMMTQQRRFDEAAQEIQQAKQDDPFWAAVYGDEAYLEANLHEFGKLSHTIDTLVNLKPDWSGTYDERAWAYWLSGHEEQAIAEWRRMAVMDHDTRRIELEDRGMVAFKSGGPRAYARLRYEAAISGKTYLHADPDFSPAEWAAYMGDYPTTLRILDQMVSKHDIACLEMSVDSAFIPLYKDARFLSLLTKVGLPSPLESNKSSRS